MLIISVLVVHSVVYVVWYTTITAHMPINNIATRLYMIANSIFTQDCAYVNIHTNCIYDIIMLNFILFIVGISCLP